MKKIIFVILLLSLSNCALDTSKRDSEQVNCGHFEICHGNHIHRNARHHTDVHHQHVEKNDAKQVSD